MTIIERLERQDNEDTIMIGQLIEKTMAGEFGLLFRKMLENNKSAELAHSRNRDTSSDKILGRLEAYETIQDDLESFVRRMNELRIPIMQETFQETEIAKEQTTYLHGGEI